MNTYSTNFDNIFYFINVFNELVLNNSLYHVKITADGKI